MTSIGDNKLAAVSASIPTWRRSGKLKEAIHKILDCNPPPSELLIHIDAGDSETGPMLAREFAGKVTWFRSEATKGPGGGRNLLMERAQNSLVAFFDDDSWPLDLDYFARASRLMLSKPDAAVITGTVSLRAPPPATPLADMNAVAVFENCACVIRREAFLQTRGFLPLSHAYGMEEADVALQLLDGGWRIYKSGELRVLHDTDLAHHPSRAVNAAHIANTGLLAWLCYPAFFWPLGVLQVLNRVRYSLRMGRRSGVLTGLAGIPSHCWRYRNHRHTVSPKTIRFSRRLARGG